jgi:hypothetical protein
MDVNTQDGDTERGVSQELPQKHPSNHRSNDSGGSGVWNQRGQHPPPDIPCRITGCPHRTDYRNERPEAHQPSTSVGKTRIQPKHPHKGEGKASRTKDVLWSRPIHEDLDAPHRPEGEEQHSGDEK